MNPRPVRAVAVVMLTPAAFGLGRWSAPDAGPSGLRLTEAEIGFAQDMSTHHDQAVLLASTLALDVTAQIRASADQRSAAQTAEIAIMRGRPALFDLPRTAEQPMSRLSAAHQHTGSAPMSGMASTAEITRPTGLRGTEAEVFFLQLMIRHHRGGVDMAQAAYDRAGNAQVRRTALEIVRQQVSEIGVMTTFLTAGGRIHSPTHSAISAPRTRVDFRLIGPAHNLSARSLSQRPSTS